MALWRMSRNHPQGMNLNLLENRNKNDPTTSAGLFVYKRSGDCSFTRWKFEKFPPWLLYCHLPPSLPIGQLSDLRISLLQENLDWQPPWKVHLSYIFRWSFTMMFAEMLKHFAAQFIGHLSSILDLL